MAAPMCESLPVAEALAAAPSATAGPNTDLETLLRFIHDSAASDLHL
ncbi:hypothetical protein HQ576_01605, partial [bacterium]|nr:hypothetical protein [bacterium]